MRKMVLLLGLVLLIFQGCMRSATVEVKAALDEQTTVRGLAMCGSGFLAFGDIKAGILYIEEGKKVEILKNYDAKKEDGGWRIDQGETSVVYKLLPLNTLDLNALAPQAAFATLKDALCTAIPTSGACMNMGNVQTNNFSFSWKTPVGGVSYCKPSLGNTCEFVAMSTGTHRTYKDPDCPKGGASAGKKTLRICQDNTE